MPVLTLEPTPSAYERFWTDFREPLREYARDLVETDADLIVAISRKAPRLLQLIVADADMPDLELERCVTEKALAFLPGAMLEGRSASVTDDTIIYGSTFTGVEERLTAAGAVTTGHVLALSNAADEHVRARIAHKALKLDEARVHELIDLEIQAFGSLAVPYDIDHPILTVPFMGGADDQVQMLLDAVPGAFEVTRPWQSSHSVRVITLPLRDVRGVSQAARQMGPRKLRVFVDEERKHLRFVSIFCLGLRTAELVHPSLFAEAVPQIDRAWRALLNAVQTGCGTEQERYRALAQASHWLAGAEALCGWLSAAPAAIDVATATFDPFDLQLLFGPQLAVRLCPELEAVLRGCRSWSPAPYPVVEPRCLDLDAEVTALERSGLGPEFLRQAKRYLEFADATDAGDLAHSVFNAQRQVYDLATRGGNPIASGRLEASLIPFPLIPRVLERLGAPLAPADFEAWADRAIDGGSVVPHYHPSLSEPDLWVRCIRAGERRNEKVKYWLRAVMRQAITDFQRLHRPAAAVAEEDVSPAIPWFVAEKVVATVVKVLEPRLRQGLGKPIVCGRDEFGARAALPESRGAYLLDWAVDCRVIERDRGITRRGRRASAGLRLSLTPAFDELFPPDGDTVGRDLRHVSRDLVQAMTAIEASFSGDQRLVALLALSTCGNYDDLVRSLSAELDVWLHSARFGASQLCADLVDIARGRPGPDPEAVAKALGNSATAVKQAEIKQDAYDRRIALRDHLDVRFREDDRLAPYAPTWDDYLRGVIDDSEPEDRRAADYLLYGAALARAAISLGRTALDQFQGPPDANRPLQRYVDQLNELSAREHNGPTGARLPELVADDFAEAADPAARLVRAARILQEVEGIVQEIWGSWQRPMPSAAMEELDRDVAVLMWDVMGSGNAAGTLQEVLHAANELIAVEIERRGGAQFVPDQNDGKAVVLFRATDAIEVFELLTERFATSGYKIRGGVETTVDGAKARRNRFTSQYGGKVFEKAARIMEVFPKTSEGAVDVEQPDGVVQKLTEPARSHLSVSARVMAVLEVEGGQVPGTLERLGIIRRYEPRLASTLPVDVHCFASRLPPV